MDWDIDACGGQIICPFDNRASLKGKLCGQCHLCVGGFCKFCFPAQRVHNVFVGAVSVDVFVAFGVACDVQVFEACFAKRAGVQKLHGAVKVAVRFGNAACQKQRLRDASLALVARDPVGKRGCVFDDPCGEVWHDVVAVVSEPFSSGYHVRDGRAFDVGDVDAGAFWQQDFEIFDLFGGARHDLDGVVLEQGFHVCVYANWFRRFFLEEWEQGHRARISEGLGGG